MSPEPETLILRPGALPKDAGSVDSPMSDVGLWWGGPLEMPHRQRLESQLSQSVAAQQRGPEPEAPDEEETPQGRAPRRGAPQLH